VLLTGDTMDRNTPVRRVQAGEVPVFLISLKAGGVGLNLTAAVTCPPRSGPPEMRVRQYVGGGWDGTLAPQAGEIVAKLRQVEVLTGQGKSVVDAVRTIGVTEATYYRWRAEYGGLKLDQVKRLKVLEQENGRLRWAVADLTLEKLVLKEAASGNW
jgi:putative transposase